MRSIATASRQMLARQPTDLWIVLYWYVIAHFFYRLVIGLQFFFPSAHGAIWLLYPKWLRDDLFTSLLYLHSQPPLFNLLVGICFKLQPEDYRPVMECVYFFIGLVGLSYFVLALARLNIGRTARLMVCIPLCSFPTLYYYATWSYTTHLEFCLCAAALYYLAGFCMERNIGALKGLFISCCLLGLLRAQWHLAIFVGLAAILWQMEKKEARRIAMIATVCLLPLAGWYAKNFWMFGFFGPSSWMGANLSQVTERLISHDDYVQLRSQGLIAPDFAGGVYNFPRVLHRSPPETTLSPDAPLALQPFKNGQAENLNYLGMIDSSRQDLHDSLVIIAHYPGRYISAILRKMWNISWRPSLAYRYRPLPIADGYEGLPDEIRDGLSLGTFLLYTCVPIFVAALASRKKWKDSLPPDWRKFIASTFYLALVMMIIGCGFNGSEQERMRWGLAPIYLCYAAMLVEMARWKITTQRQTVV